MNNSIVAKIREETEERLTLQITTSLKEGAEKLKKEFSQDLTGQVLKDTCDIVEQDLQEKLTKVPDVVKAMLDEADRNA